MVGNHCTMGKTGKGGTVFLKTSPTPPSQSQPVQPQTASHNSTVCKPPPPPIRRSSSICSQDSNRTSTFRNTNEDEDITPHGSMENVNVLSPNQDRLSLEAMVAKASSVASNLTSNFDPNSSTLRRSTSMSTNGATPAPPISHFDRDQFLRRSLTLTSRSDRANLINSLTERISQRMNHQGTNGSNAKISTHHVIPVNGAALAASAVGAPAKSPPVVNQNNNKQPSPEGEIYGFGAKFKETRQQYFDMSASYPSSMSAENQKFLDNLSSKLLNKEPIVNVTTTEKNSRFNTWIGEDWWTFFEFLQYLPYTDFSIPKIFFGHFINRYSSLAILWWNKHTERTYRGASYCFRIP